MTTEAELERVLWSLRAYDVLALATADPDGPHVAGVFFAPAARGGGLHLIIATLGETALQRAMRRDTRVAFLCSPGNASRWIQGTGTAEVIDDTARHADLHERLLAHAPGARVYVERFAAVPAIITVKRLKIVDAIDATPRLLEFPDQ
ncbi:MAG: pyridoxamine 5'-phosphate oxidase family protein [Candidatus Dormibacteraeota bacterium]|nr:pyridoxamine 5'-phosphate oxidase family protein [Candidatus Dormibacteraeota bacterium]